MNRKDAESAEEKNQPRRREEHEEGRINIYSSSSLFVLFAPSWFKFPVPLCVLHVFAVLPGFNLGSQ